MNNELLTVLSYLEREKGINRDILIETVEFALQSAAKKSMGTSRDVRVSVDPKTCEITTFQTLIVSDNAKGIDYITLENAQKVKPDAQIGDAIELKVVPKDFGRIAAQTAKQAIMQRIRQAERDVVFDRYRNQEGKIITATVKSIMRGDYICEADGGGEAMLAAKDRLPTDVMRQGEKFRAYLKKVEVTQTAPSITLSRTAPEFVKALFFEQSGEIKEGIVEVMGIAREPGFRTKMAVRSLDPKVDAVGACVGLRGSRIKPVIQELNGEKIDIVEWSEDIRKYAEFALAPAKLEGVKISEDAPHTIVAIVHPDHYTQAIGKFGQNVRLTAQLLGWKISVVKSEVQSEASFEEQLAAAIENLANLEGISAEEAEQIVKAGFLTPEGITELEPNEFIEAAGLEHDFGMRVWNGASAFLAAKKEEEPGEEPEPNEEPGE